MTNSTFRTLIGQYTRESGTLFLFGAGFAPPSDVCVFLLRSTVRHTERNLGHLCGEQPQLTTIATKAWSATEKKPLEISFLRSRGSRVSCRNFEVTPRLKSCIRHNRQDTYRHRPHPSTVRNISSGKEFVASRKSAHRLKGF